MSAIESKFNPGGEENKEREYLELLREAQGMLERKKGKKLNLTEAAYLHDILKKKIEIHGEDKGDVFLETKFEFMEHVVGIPAKLFNDPGPGRLSSEQVRVLWEKYNRESKLI